MRSPHWPVSATTVLQLWTSITAICLLFAPSLPLVSAQTTSPSTFAASGSASATARNVTAGIIVTTTTLVQTITPTSSGASPVRTSLVLTLTLNHSATDASPTLSSGNASSVTFSNGTTVFANGTISSNSTLSNVTDVIAPYNGTQTSLPFEVRLDGAYGVTGAFLILTGAFVGVLGGKHRWSSMAIVSGYSVLLFSLVMILSFGLEPNLQPPSPQPPSATLRGIYVLACIIASFIGAGAGLFFYKYTKYWVCAMGGFAFAWFLLACRAGGLVGGSIVGRWALIGGCSVIGFISGLFESWHAHVLLVATAWIGATAFTLGIDCFSRAGLKEFYIYNFGYWDLFPKLNGYPYPLLTLMQVELGILGACFLIGMAIQYKVLGKIAFQVKRAQEEEKAKEERKEAVEAERRAKRHEEELTQWEEKHGSGPGSRGGSGDKDPMSSTVDLPIEHAVPSLPRMGMGGRPSSQLSLLAHERNLSSTASATENTSDEQTEPKGLLPRLELGDSLAPSLGVVDRDPALQEKEKLLDEIKKVRASIEVLRSGTPTSMMALGDDATAGRSKVQSTAQSLSSARSAPLASRDSDWDAYVSERQIYTPPAGVSPLIPAGTIRSVGRLSHISPDVISARDRRERTLSTLSAFELGSMAEFGAAPSMDPTRRYSSTTQIRAHRRPPPVISGHADSRVLSRPAPRSASPSNVVSFEELQTRHRQRLSQLQKPVTESMTSELRLAEAKAKHERRLAAERRAAAAAASSPPLEERLQSPPRRRTQSGLDAVPRESGVERASKWRSSVVEAESARRPTDVPRRKSEDALRTDRRTSRGPHQFIN